LRGEGVDCGSLRAERQTCFPSLRRRLLRKQTSGRASPLPLWERVVRAEGEDRVRGFALVRLPGTPHPARCSLALATTHPLPQGERESAFAARFGNNPFGEEGGECGSPLIDQTAAWRAPCCWK